MGNIDAVAIEAHGTVSADGTHRISLGNGEIYARQDNEMNHNDITVDSLNLVKMKELHINACNSGNWDIYNSAYTFKMNNDIEAIYAWDGGTTFDKRKGEYVPGGGDYHAWKKDPWESVKKYQPT